MAKVEFDIETPLGPEAVKAALLDFSDRRPAIWPSLSPDEYKVYSVGDNHADVREGSRMPAMTIWAREHYDWSRPGVVRWTVQESSFCTPGSYVETRLTERGDGGTIVHVEWDRTGVGVFGRFLVALIRLSRGKPLRSSIETTLRMLERQAASTGSSPT